MPTLELFQFDLSHFNEKARWTLDWKGVPHVRQSLLPGLHAPTMLRMTGKTEVPVLREGERIVAGSAAIIDFLEERHPAPPLYPADPALRERALEVQAWFDEHVGPQGRCAFFFDLLEDSGYSARCFSQQKGPVARAAYRAFFPVTRLLMTRSMQIDATSAEAGRARVREGLDFITKHVGPAGYLVGDRFSVADLTAACLLQHTTFPPEVQPNLPEPRARAAERWLGRWADHPGTRWIAETYRRHRGRSAAAG